jgi:osmotically-inducible protein OsmY
MAMQISNIKLANRMDEAIQDEIRRSLWNEETIQFIDFDDISVTVENGQVCFFGHVSDDRVNRRIEDITRSIPGVVAVHNHLVTDPDLSKQITQALCNYEPTRLLILQVYSHNGWVELNGSVPNREMQSAAEASAARVPAVRGIIRIPEIMGEQSPMLRVAVQPRIGLRVFVKDETQGLVYQVVITPQNRLVTHAVVRVNRKANGWQEATDYLIPVDAMDVVDLSGVSLKNSSPAIFQFPGFNPADYPYAPLTWQPPYPYLVGNVRWPRLEKMNSKQ